MSATTSTNELRKMQPKDLLKEIDEKRMELAKMSLGIQMSSYKDTAKYQREKKLLARMLTIMGQLNSAQEPSKMPAPVSSSPKAKKTTKKRSGTSTHRSPKGEGGPATTSKQ